MGMMARRNSSDGNRFSVTLNGSPLEDVLWADEETGQSEVYEHAWAPDQWGQRILNVDSATGYRTLVVCGDIRIIDHEPSEQPSLTFGDPWPDWTPC
jgi:hypothetical protein